jgi:DNA primase
MAYNKDFKKKLYHYWTQKWGMFEYTRGWLKGDCPDCGKLKFGVNLFSGKANCFSCGDKGTPIKFAMVLEGVNTFQEIAQIIRNYDGQGYASFEKLGNRDKDRERNISLPDEYILVTLGNSRIGKRVRQYLKGRGFNLNRLEEAGVGYCDRGEYLGHIIIPYYHLGELVYFNARRIIGSGSKFNNPKEEETGIGKSTVMYNSEALLTYKTVWLLESATNCLTIGSKATGLGGKTVSDTQLSFILRSPVRRVIIGLDRDAILWAIKIALKLIKHKEVKIIEFPDKRDINDLGKSKSVELAREARYLSYNDLLRLKRAYEKDPEFTYN